MARPKIYGEPSERYAKYRRRVTEERNRLNQLRMQAQGLLAPDDSALDTEEWFGVKLTINRHELDDYAELAYILSGSELLRLQNDLNRFRTQEEAPAHGTYAYADSGQQPTGIPGTTTIGFYGLTVTSTSLIPKFQPPSTYSISLGQVRLLMNRFIHPFMLSTIEDPGPRPQS